MAGEWIKMRVWIARDPKVIAMTDYLAAERYFINWLTDPVRCHCKETVYEHVTRNVTRCVTVVGLLQVWGVANELGRPEGNDLVMRHANLDRLDEIADVPCFGDAMQHVGWAKEEDDGHGNLQVRFPNFLSNNIPVEERVRSSAADRQRRYRERKQQTQPSEGSTDDDPPAARYVMRDVTRVTPNRNKRDGREEKITEQEKKKEPPLPPSGASAEPTLGPQEFLAAWNGTGLLSVRKFGPARSKMFRARIKDRDWLRDWREALDCAAKLPFCKGHNDRGWIATVDWFLRPETVTKILEGFYDRLHSAKAGPLPKTEEQRIANYLKDKERQAQERERVSPEVVQLAARLKMPRKEGT